MKKAGRWLKAHIGTILGAAVLAAVAVFGLTYHRQIWAILTQEKARDAFIGWARGSGLAGVGVFMGIQILQVVVAVLPGEPLEIAAGYAFGAWRGMLLCLTGAVLGCALVMAVTRRFGPQLMRAFFKQEQIDSLSFLQNRERLRLILFIVFFIPGSPKDLLNYGLGLTRLRMPGVLLITGVARIPSIITSTVGGSALGEQNYLFAAAVFVGTALLSALGLLCYRRITRAGSHADK